MKEERSLTRRRGVSGDGGDGPLDGRRRGADLVDARDHEEGEARHDDREVFHFALVFAETFGGVGVF